MGINVSVAIPCYNGMAYIGQTIESILKQSRPADEIIVVDDGSSDMSVAIASKYAVEIIQHEKNQGLAIARNTAIDKASGEVLVFIDVDAMADSDLLESLLAGYDVPGVVGVGGQGIEANIHSLADRWRQIHATQGHGHKQKQVDHLYGLCMSYRTEILRQVGGFSPRFRTNAEDVDIGLRITAAGHTLLYLPEAKVYHQRTDNEESLKRTMAAWRVSAYHAKRLNNARPWTLFAGTLRRLITEPLHDFVRERDAKLARLSWQIGWIKLHSLWKAAIE